jgi:hypothetical protein
MLSYRPYLLKLQSTRQCKADGEVVVDEAPAVSQAHEAERVQTHSTIRHDWEHNGHLFGKDRPIIRVCYLKLGVLKSHEVKRRLTVSLSALKAGAVISLQKTYRR